MERRDFVRFVAAAPLAGWAASLPAAAQAATAPADRYADGEPDWVCAVRRELPACQEGVYLQTGSFGPSSNRVVARVRDLMDAQLRGPALPECVTRLQAAEDACRPALARLLGAKPEEVALTHNTTEGLNIAIWSIDWKTGDEIITGDQEHAALLAPCYNLQDRFGVHHRKVAVGPGEDVVANVLAAVTPRTRLVAMSHVSRQTGRAIPVRALATALHGRGVRLLLDAAQATGNVRFDFGASGCDYYAFCGHKWLLAPKGVGGLLVRRDLLEQTPVSYTGAHAHQKIDGTGTHVWHPDARRFEYGTRDQFNFGGFAEAVQTFESLGPERVFARIQELSLRVARAVEASGRLQLLSSTGDDRSGIVAVRLPAGADAKTVTRRLLEQDRILVSPLEQPRDLRLSVHFFNTWPELELTLQRLSELT